MKVNLDNQLIDYLHNHHRENLTLTLMTDVHNIYSYGITKYPVINYKKPRNMDLYDTYEFGDITVYIAKNVKAINDELQFVDKKTWRFHRCHVKGIQYDHNPDTIMKHWFRSVLFSAKKPRKGFFWAT